MLFFKTFEAKGNNPLLVIAPFISILIEDFVPLILDN